MLMIIITLLEFSVRRERHLLPWSLMWLRIDIHYFSLFWKSRCSHSSQGLVCLWLSLLGNDSMTFNEGGLG